jgi:hypothetical protein
MHTRATNTPYAPHRFVAAQQHATVVAGHTLHARDDRVDDRLAVRVAPAIEVQPVRLVDDLSYDTRVIR